MNVLRLSDYVYYSVIRAQATKGARESLHARFVKWDQIALDIHFMPVAFQGHQGYQGHDTIHAAVWW